jgi:putative copper resistance protein D
MKNPVPISAASLAVGKRLYLTNCSSCHGPLGKGDGKAGELLTPKPADLTDTTWKHGGMEADVFMTIRDGAKGTGMKGFGGRLTTQELWQLVNYVRSLSQYRQNPE